MWQDADGRFGRDFSGDGSVEREDDDPMDTNGHGTHVAGTIAAIGNNGVGIIGVAPKVKIMAVKIFPHATDNVVVRALKYAVDNGARVINNSWGPRNRRQSSLTIEAAVDYVHAKGGICVFAAGNNNDDVQFYSPANRPNTIAVAATDSNDAKASFSNYGVLVDVAAPGVDILSTQKGTINYVNKSGTSMAAPHVSGAVALLLSSNPKLDFNAVYNVLRATSVPVSSAVPIGAGRINCHNMLAASIATPLVRAKTISHDGANGTYLVQALDPITQVPLTGDIHQNGVKVGTVGAPFSVPLVCETKTTRTRVCDMERKPPCVWEVDVVTVCEPSPNSFVLSCPDFKDVSFKLPKFTDHEFEQPS
jgi:subtilisin family serine protease